MKTTSAFLFTYLKRLTPRDAAGLVIPILVSIFYVSNAQATIISTDVAAGMTIRYRNSANTLLTDASGSNSGITNTSVNVTGNVTGVSLFSSVEGIIVSPDQVNVSFRMLKSIPSTGSITTSGYPDGVWGNRFHVSYYADQNLVLRYTWDIEAPGLLSPAPYYGLAGVLIDTDQDTSNGYLQYIRSGNNPGNYAGIEYLDLFAGTTYDFIVALYHHEGFTAVSSTANTMSADFTFDFTSNDVPEPSTILLVIAGFIGIGFSRRKVALDNRDALSHQVQRA